MPQSIEIDPETAAAIECAEAEGIGNFVQGAPPAYAHEHGISVVRIDRTVAVTFKTLDNPVFNRIVGLGVASPATEELLDELLSIYRVLDIHNISVPVSPHARPAELPKWLEDRGFVVATKWAKFWRGPEPAPVANSDIRIEEVGKEAAPEFARVVREGFGIPPFTDPVAVGTVGSPGWKSYLGFDGSEAVACSTMRIEDGVGWLGSAATLPSHRGKGAQRAMIARRIADGIAEGCRLFTVETGLNEDDSPNASYRNMVWGGFHLAYERPNYRRPPAETPGAGADPPEGA